MARIFIGIGSSINRRENIIQGVVLLKENFGNLRLSSVFESESVGFDGGLFYNLVAELESNFSTEFVIKQLKEIEIKQGRPQNTIKYAPRTLDLDLLLYDNYINKEQDIPRAEITTNAFVLQPLAELAPTLIHPVLGVCYQDLWQQYPINKQKLWKITTFVF